ncbi:MAG: hypothetical protein HYS38_03730 [Acidobacteria bacterium]|nr:hypothetical protein [Acidobacteriota bacterium]
MKRCTKCQCEKPLEDFPKNKATRDGRGSWCRSCTADYYKTYFETTRGKTALTRAIKSKQAAGYYRFGKGAIPILRQGAKTRGITFTLTAESLETWWQQIPDRCSYCGITTEEFKRLRDFVVSYDGTDYEILKFKRILKSAKHRAINWLTLDRVNNSRGYELDNLVKCCWFCNSMKGSLLEESDMKAIAQNVIRRLQGRIAAANENT